MSRPVLLNSCAGATTAAESKYRLDYALVAARATCVVALDTDAEEAVRAAAELEWNAARFYSLAAADGSQLALAGGQTASLAAELEGVDAVIMVATTDDGAGAAATIGAACSERGVMTAGLVITPPQSTSQALLALRPYARILLVPADQDDLVGLLKAIRA